MIKKQFYSHLIEIEYLHTELDTLELSDSEKDELKKHVHGSVHYVALDVVLSELAPEHKSTFIEHLNNANHDELWKHLKENTQNIEEKLKMGIEKIIQEFHDDVKRIKEKA